MQGSNWARVLCTRADMFCFKYFFKTNSFLSEKWSIALTPPSDSQSYDYITTSPLYAYRYHIIFACNQTNEAPLSYLQRNYQFELHFKLSSRSPFHQPPLIWLQITTEILADDATARIISLVPSTSSVCNMVHAITNCCCDIAIWIGKILFALSSIPRIGTTRYQIYDFLKSFN